MTSPAHPTTVLIGHGTRDAEGAQEALAFAARLADHLAERLGPGWPVVPCFIGITRPSLEEGLARCLTLGARRVLVLPYFLFTGVLVRRIDRIVAEVAARHPTIDFRVGAHLGCHPRLLDLVVRRVEEAHRGAVRMSCDRCKYRVPLIGYQEQVGRPQTSDGAHGLREAGSTADHDHPHPHNHAHAPQHHHPHVSEHHHSHR